MTCSCAQPKILEANSTENSALGKENQGMLPGENIDCYMKRAESPTGLKDDATEWQKNKIKNTGIPVNADGSINVTFTLTPDSDRTPTNWVYTGLPSWLTAGGTNNATISGTCPPAERGKVIQILVKAVDGTGDIDSISYKVAPDEANNDNSIQLINPLPGGTVTSPFSHARVGPVDGVVRPHKGIDLSTPGPRHLVTDIVAAADGVVVGISTAGPGGNGVTINHFTASGKLLCQTFYCHLQKIYVEKNQRVAASQKIGLEGSTGRSTGNHLHFECRLLNENGSIKTWIDPLPLIRGQTNVAGKTNPDNTPVEGTVQPQTSDARLTTSNADSRGGCPPFGPNYPSGSGSVAPAPAPGTPPVPPPSAGPFEQAWFFTLKHEVGPHWMSTPQNSPGDPEVDAGAKDTKQQKFKVGYVKLQGDTGGLTKFGVAQNPNPRVDVENLDYAGAKQFGYNVFWLGGAAALFESSKPKLAVMLFDMSYLHGPVSVKKYILEPANIGSLSDADACKALHDAQKQYLEKIIARRPTNERFRNGWFKRSKELLDYALSLP